MPLITDEVTVTVTVRGLLDGQQGETAITSMIKRALYMVDGAPGQFGARIEGPSGAIELDGNGEWQRARDSNPRGSDPNLLSGQAP